MGGRVLQKKKNRSSIPKIKLKPKSKKVNPLGNPIIAANWKQTETLTQNYRRLGLTARLNSATGGIEKLRPGDESKSSTSEKLRIANLNLGKTVIEPTEVRVERDGEGRIVRVLHPASKSNPLHDPLNTSDEDGGMDEDEEGEEEFGGFEDDGDVDGGSVRKGGEENNIVRQLEEQASRIPEKKERKQSEREREWIERLVGKYGADYGKMFRDRRLNPMQQTEADIRRRVEKWRASGGSVDVAS